MIKTVCQVKFEKNVLSSIFLNFLKIKPFPDSHYLFTGMVFKNCLMLRLLNLRTYLCLAGHRQAYLHLTGRLVCRRL